MQPLPLPAREVHLWWAYPDDPRHEAARERQDAVLSADELARERRFLRERHRRDFRVSHSLVRSVLSRYAPGVEPARWAFGAREHGRPHIAGPDGYDWLRFNLSHTDARAVVAVMRGVDVGVDVENTRARGGDDGVAEAHYHPAEIAQYRRNPACFFNLWTLKEAFLKAIGAGLGTLPLDTFAFDLADPARPRIAFVDPAAQDQSQQWEFCLQRGVDFCLALAANTGGAPFTVVERTMVPLE